MSPSIKLSTGYEMPLVGLGTWQSKPGEVGAAVELALLNGYKAIDCAWIYGNQKEIGEVFHKVFEKDVKREDVFITSKVWNTFHSYAKAKENIQMILDDLQLEYIDLLLIHWPVGYEEGSEALPRGPDGVKMRYSNEDYMDTWMALEEAQKEGKVRTIGLSNFNHKQIQRVIDNGTVKPAVLQVETHPYFQQKKLREFCKEKNIAVTAYSSLGNPGSALFRKEGDANILDDAVIGAIAQKHGKSPAQIALRWAVQNGICVIPKSTNEDRIKQNADVFSFVLSDDDMTSLSEVDRKWRIMDPTFRDSDHPHFSFNEEF